jgi:alkylation response protein AidB-like acyl-CoA dehydrogenase
MDGGAFERAILHLSNQRQVSLLSAIAGHADERAGEAGGRVKIFSEQHDMFRQTVRSFVEKEVEPHIEEWEQAGQIPKSIWPVSIRAKQGYYAPTE